ncbi:MCE family protein [Pseudonocardia acaciae]|uniref:MCE family protein n=1 Tax=Pseudonocardia acaciae TaxID=551276 RepID=UPI0012EE90C4|nr:MCE family protein [Pseudonocardia acaciae]
MRLLVLLTALLALVATAGCGVFTPAPMVVTAQFRDSVGLYEGNDVTILGIKVGTVTRIRPSGTHVTAELAIDPGTKIPADAGAVTMSPSVVTDRRVELTPAYRGGPMMRDGDLIPLDRTRTPVEIDRVFAAADRLATQLSAAESGRPALGGAVDTAAETFKGNGDKLRAALRGIADTVSVGADYRDQLVELIRNVDHLTKTAAENDATIRSFSTHLTEATALLDGQGPNLVRVLDNTVELLDRADKVISENRGPARHTIDNLRVTAHTMAGRTRELAESADVLPTTFHNLVGIIDPQRGRARVHAGLDQILLDHQLLQLACQRVTVPAVCTGIGGGGGSPVTNSLSQLLLGGAR